MSNHLTAEEQIDTWFQVDLHDPDGEAETMTRVLEALFALQRLRTSGYRVAAIGIRCVRPVAVEGEPLRRAIHASRQNQEDDV